MRYRSILPKFNTKLIPAIEDVSPTLICYTNNESDKIKIPTLQCIYKLEIRQLYYFKKYSIYLLNNNILLNNRNRLWVVFWNSCSWNFFIKFVFRWNDSLVNEDKDIPNKTPASRSVSYKNTCIRWGENSGITRKKSWGLFLFLDDEPKVYNYWAQNVRIPL